MRRRRRRRICEKKYGLVNGRNKAENKYVNDKKKQEDKRKNGLTDGGRKEKGRGNLNSNSHRTDDTHNGSVVCCNCQVRD